MFPCKLRENMQNSAQAITEDQVQTTDHGAIRHQQDLPSHHTALRTFTWSSIIVENISTNSPSSSFSMRSMRPATWFWTSSMCVRRFICHCRQFLAGSPCPELLSLTQPDNEIALLTCTQTYRASDLTPRVGDISVYSVVTVESSGIFCWYNKVMNWGGNHY